MAVQNKSALGAYQRILARVRKDYPAKDFRWQQQKASEIMHSGKKPAAVGRKKSTRSGTRSKAKVSGKKAVGKRPAIIVEQSRKSGTHRKHTDSHVSRALKIQGIINKLEETRSQQTTKQMKDIVQRAINMNHDKLKKIDRQMRTRRA